MIELFKKIVDFSKPIARKTHSGKTYDEIVDILRPSHDNKFIEKSELVKIQRYFIIHNQYFEVHDQIYCPVISKFIDFARSGDRFLPIEVNDQWIQAVSLIRGLLLEKEDSVDLGLYDVYYSEEMEIANAGKYFRENGYELDLTLDGLSLSMESKRQWVTSTKDHIAKIGGINFLKLLHTHKDHLFNEKLNRYLIYREIGDFHNPTKPQIPFGYLMNLGIQFIEEVSPSEDTINIFKHILKESKMFATLYAVQPYHLMEGMFYTPGTFIKATVSSILWDNIYSFNQLNFNYLKSILPLLFDFVKGEDFKSTHGFTKNQFYEVTNKIMDNYNRYDVIVKPRNFRSMIDINTLVKILDFLAIPHTEVNKDYDMPEDFGAVNFQDKPLIKFSKGYYLADKSWCAPAFITCMANLCAEAYKDGKNAFWSELGLSTERFIRSKFEEKGIDNMNGIYLFGSKSAECDFVIQDDKRIVFIETKNKELTKKSKAGKDIEVLYDLLLSVVSSIEQTSRHKYALETQGFIKFDDGREIRLEGRQIERVGLSFEEFGSIHSTTSTLELLRNLFLSELKIIGDVDPKIIQKINNVIKKFKASTDDLVSNPYSRKEFFDCKFFSLPMLLLMLDNSTSNKDLIDALLRFKFINTTARDFYIDYIHSLNLNIATQYVK